MTPYDRDCNNLICGHPAECWEEDNDEEDAHCGWCQEVQHLQTLVDCLRNECKDRMSIMVTGGNVSTKGDIAILEVLGGTVACGTEVIDIVKVGK